MNYTNQSGKERSHPFPPLPWLGLTFLVTRRRDRGDSVVMGTLRMQAQSLGTRRAKAELTEDVTIFCISVRSGFSSSSPGTSRHRFSGVDLGVFISTGHVKRKTSPNVPQNSLGCICSHFLITKAIWRM